MKKVSIGIILVFLVVFIQIINLNLFKHEYYLNKYYEKSNIYVYGKSAKRGRILDVNGKVLVDNIGIKTIYYNKLNKIYAKDEIKIAYALANILDIEVLDEDVLKKFWLVKNEYGKELVTKEEYKLYKERKINTSDILELKMKRIDLSSFNLLDKKAASIYYLMNKDYNYQKKVIKENVTDDEYAQIIESNIKGITAEVKWERSYLYEDTLKSIFGSVSKIYAEEKEYYLQKGYSLTDEVGVSFLEKEYEKYLQGKKAIYKVNNNNSLKLIRPEEAGNDLYLSIDIAVQLKLEEIVKTEMLKAKEKEKTKYFNDLYIGISNPLNGKIVAVSGMRLIDNKKEYTFSEITNEIITSSFTVGSVIKGATITVGYQNNLINPNKFINDSCVKLEFIPLKCSWKSLGRINDIKALELSSNYYQYLLAIGLTNKKYVPNMKLNVTKKEFQIYRDTLKEYGLGTNTGIDLPDEFSGVQGSTIADDLLLNLAIGQYDTYTLLSLIQYINTIANNKKRIELSLLDRVMKNEILIYEKENKVLNEVNLDDVYYERIKLGFNKVLMEGTGRGYIDNKYLPVGKTGTSESFLDTDNDGVVDVSTMSLTFVGYAPIDNPKYSIAIIAPHIAYKIADDDYIYRITRYISKSITDFLFEKE